MTDKCSKSFCKYMTIFIVAALSVIMCVAMVGVFIIFNRRFIEEHCSDKHFGEACQSGPCQNGGTCSISGVTYICTCTEKFMGRNCDKHNPCYDRICKNGGNCSVSDGRAICACPHGFSGVQCELEESPCHNSSCRNGGTCSQVENGYQCACIEGFYGRNCEKDNPCLPNPCKNGADCSTSGDAFHCACPVTHSGSLCEKEKAEETEIIQLLKHERTIYFTILGIVCAILALAIIFEVRNLIIYIWKKRSQSCNSPS